MKRRWEDHGDHLVDIAEVSMAALHDVAEDCRLLREIGHTESHGVRHLAQIPGILIEQYINDSGIDFREFMTNPEHATRMLNDPALAAFRVHPGRV